MNTPTNPRIDRKTVREWLSQPFEWRIPVYQRHYAWNADEEFGPTQQFWEVVEDQARRRLDGDVPAPHYFGAILVEENRNNNLDAVKKFDVVDGQQRLTTLTIALFSLIGLAAQKNYKEKFKRELAEYIFSDSSANPPKAPRLRPTNFDQGQYENLLYHVYPDSEPTPRKNREDEYGKSMVVRACYFFNQRLAKFFDKNDRDDAEATIEALQGALLDGFDLVAIPLKETDEAQKIFEALNNAAKPLTTFDLIRNNIFHRADKQEPGLDETLFHDTKWQQFESPFWEIDFNKKGDNKHIEEYISRMLVAKKKRFMLLTRNSIYREYKKFFINSENVIGVKKEIESISEYVDVYKYVVGETLKNPISDDFDFGYFQSNYKGTSVFLPVIFVVATSDALESEKQRMLKLLESWLMRRNVCGLTGDYNKQVPTLCGQLGLRPNYAKLDSFLNESNEETRMFPDNEQVKSRLYGVNFYKLAAKQHVFERIVRHTTSDSLNEKRDLKGLTIDHILPQEWENWGPVLGDYGEGRINTAIHTIGNLTPMAKGLNSGKSNKSWEIARDWLAKSDLKMTRDIAEHESWSIPQIDERSKELARVICEIWPCDIA